MTPPTKRMPYPQTLDRIAEYPGVVTISGWQNVRIVSWAAPADGPAVVADGGAPTLPRWSGT